MVIVCWVNIFIDAQKCHHLKKNNYFQSRLDGESVNDGSTNRTYNEPSKPPRHKSSKTSSKSKSSSKKSHIGVVHESAWEKETEMGMPPPATYVTKVNHTHDLMVNVLL